MVTPPKRVSREIRSARVSRRPPSFAVTLVALAIVFALAWMFFVRSGPSASAPLVKGIQGTYTWRPGEGRVGEDGTFGAVAGGNAGGKAGVPEDETVFSSHPPESAYDAATRTETTVGGNGGSVALATRTVGEWPPVWRVATHSPLDYQGLAAIVRTAVEDGDEAVGIKPVKDGERAAWRAAMTLDGKEVERRRRPADRHRHLVQRRRGHLHGDGRLGLAAAGRRDLHGRRAGGDGGGDDRRRGRLRGVAGGRGAHRRLPPARLGPGARRLRSQGRRHAGRRRVRLARVDAARIPWRPAR